MDAAGNEVLRAPGAGVREGAPPVNPALRARLAERQVAVLDTVLGSAAPQCEPEHADVAAALVHAVLDRFVGVDPAGAGSRGPREALHAVGGRYAACGVSLAHASYELHWTIIEMTRMWWASASPLDIGELLQLNRQTAEAMGAMRAELSDGYCATLAASGSRALGRDQLVDALLNGRPVTSSLLRAAGVRRAGHYLVLTTLEPPASVLAGEVAERFGIPGVLPRRTEDQLDVLVPVQADEAPAHAAGAAFARLAAVTGAVVAGAAVAPIAGLPAAAEEARVALRIAAACDRRGAVLPREVLVERALGGSAPAVKQLVGLVGALAHIPYLAPTLATLYKNDLDRGLTASHLQIARRTLTNRLDRIHQLTGIHPTSARGVQTLLSALAAARLLGTEGEPDPARAG
jgi:PucR C-terminal helix-turn-helix domain